jgi:hypothetical protein
MEMEDNVGAAALQDRVRKYGQQVVAANRGALQG